jgi:hypothetical protein
MKLHTKFVFAAFAAVLSTGCAATDAAPAASAPTVCVISGEDADGGPTADFNGQTVGFCCNNCKRKWDKMDDAARRAAIAKLGN